MKNRRNKDRLYFSALLIAILSVSVLTFAGCKGSPRDKKSANLPVKPVEVKLGALEDIPSVTDWNKKDYEALVVSPDEQWIAVAGFDETIKLFSAMGELKWTFKIPESYGRSVTVSPDSKTVFAGECSMDGNVYAIDLNTGKKEWTYAVGNDVGRPESIKNTRWTEQACVYALIASRDSLFAIGTRSKRVMLDLPDGSKIVHYPTETLLYRFNPENGKMLWRYPEKEIMDTRMPYPLFSEPMGQIVGANTSWRRKGAPEEKYLNGTVRLINAETGTQSNEYRIEPAIMDYTSLWYGLSVSPNGKFVAAAVNDGRLFLFKVEKGPALRLLWRRDITKLLTVSGIPIYAGGKYSAVFDDGSVFVVSGNTYAKRTVADAEQEPPTEHPESNSVFLFGNNGDILWKWKAPGAIDGLSVLQESGLIAVLVNHNYIKNSLEASGFYFMKYQAGEKEPVARLGDFQLKGISVTGGFSPKGAYFTGIEVPIKLENNTVTGEHSLHIIPVKFIVGE